MGGLLAGTVPGKKKLPWDGDGLPMGAFFAVDNPAPK